MGGLGLPRCTGAGRTAGGLASRRDRAAWPSCPRGTASAVRRVSNMARQGKHAGEGGASVSRHQAAILASDDATCRVGREIGLGSVVLLDRLHEQARHTQHDVQWEGHASIQRGAAHCPWMHGVDIDPACCKATRQFFRVVRRDQLRLTVLTIRLLPSCEAPSKPLVSAKWPWWST